MLVDTVVWIASEPEHSLKTIIFQETLKVLPNLTRRQLYTLACIFIVRFVLHNDATNMASFFGKVLEVIKVSELDGVPTRKDFRHLEYCGCGTHSVLGQTVYHLFTDSYPGLMAQGYDVAPLLAAFAPDRFPPAEVMRCLRDANKFQIAAINTHVLAERSRDWTQHQKDVALTHFTSNLIDEQTFYNELNLLGKGVQQFVRFWNATDGISNFSLTSVGIAAAYTFISTRIEFPPLDDWI